MWTTCIAGLLLGAFASLTYAQYGSDPSMPPPPEVQDHEVSDPLASAARPHIEDSSPPILISKIEPTYSEEARAACYQGSMYLSLVVDATGNPRDIHVLRHVGLGLDEKAVEAVSKWQFKPGTRGGQPVATTAQVAVNFHLSGCINEAIKSASDLRVQIMQVQWNNSSWGASGFGRANLIGNNVKQGFEFGFSCARPFLASEGDEYYPATWKKPGYTLTILIGEMGKPGKHGKCELKINPKAFTYQRNENGSLFIVPLKGS